MSKRVENWSMGVVLLLIIGFVLAAPAMLAGCAAITPPAPTTPAQTVYDIKAGLIGVEDIALAYARTKCAGASPCSAPGMVQIAKAMIAADAAVNVAEDAVKANSTDTSAIAKAQDAVRALQALVAQFAPPATAPPTTTAASTGGVL